MAMHACPQCQSDRLVNNGSVAGQPKKLCRRCGFQCTRTTPRGKPLTTKITAVLLYLSGLSMHRIAFLLRVSAPSVLNWSRTFAKAHEEKPEPAGKTIVLQLDEMWHDLKRKRQKLWIWKALDQVLSQFLFGVWVPKILNTGTPLTSPASTVNLDAIVSPRTFRVKHQWKSYQ
jgi:transposase